MRHFLAALFLGLVTLTTPAFAGPDSAPAGVIVGQCGLDQTVTSGSDIYTQCPSGDQNNYLTSQGYNGARLEPNDILSMTPIFQYGVCRYVDARGTTNSTFIPFGNAGDWNAFVGNVPSGVAATQCCVPRTLRVSDVPVPTEACNNGNWRLDALVSPSNFNTVLATPTDAGSLASGFVLASGVTENPNYPITSLPIERGDIGSVLPLSATPNNVYVGRFICGFGRQPVGLDSAPAADIGGIAYSSFRMQCDGATWTGISPTICVNSKTTQTHTCQQDGYSASYTGSVYYLVNQVCQAGGGKLDQLTKVLDTCVSNCVAGDFGAQFTEACPSGQTGIITKVNVRSCPSGAVSTRVVSNTCVASCTPGQEGATFTQACNTDQSGILTLRHVRQCPANTVVDEVVSDTCACTPTRNLDNVVRNCPDGYTGSKTYSVVRTCFGRQPVGLNSVPAAYSDVCQCQNTETLISNTCVPACVPGVVDTFTENCPSGQTGVINKRHVRQCPSGTIITEEVSRTCTNICTPSDNTVNEACPSGQTGQILVRTQHVCDGSNGGAGQDIVTRTNQCVAACVPGQVDTFTENCPDGYTGVINKRHVRQCPSGTIITEEVSRTCTPTCVPGVVDSFTENCPSGETGVINKRHVRQCPSGTIVTEEVSRTCTPTCVPGQIDTFNESCPSGQVGTIVKRHVRQCPSGTIVVEEVTRSCEPVCTPGQVDTFTESCPSGYAGLITKRHVRVCPSGEVVVEQVSNTCAPVCTPSDNSVNEPCASGQTGQIVVRTQHLCDGSNGGFGRDVITRTNQCVAACVPGELSSFTENCPSGYAGLITKRRVRVCPSGIITEELVSNTCSPVCTPTDSTVTDPCPAGYQGGIYVRRQHLCDGSNGGFGRDVVTSDNQCHPVCTPTINTTSRACPSGYNGVIVVTSQHICDGSNGGFGRDTVTESNQCTLPPVITPPAPTGDSGGDGGC